MYKGKELPLISILIPNFNHARYLDQCIQSAIDQTYPNKEIILMDNSSTDDSLKIAEKYKQYGVLVNRNQCNIMNHNYKILTSQYCRGEYFILYCADDYAQPEFIEHAVAVMEKYPHVGYVHGERDFVTPDNELIELDPFYKCSFVAPGKKIMPIYMITTIAHPAQAVVRRAAFDHIGGYDMEIDHMNADRALWFYLSYEYDAAYIRQKMCRIRVGGQTETIATQQNFQHPILCHLTVKDFVNFARNYNLPEVYKREEEALQRLAREFVGYAGGMLYIDDLKTAQTYLDYAKVVSRDVVKENLYVRYGQMIQSESVDKSYIEQVTQVSYQHKRGYEPPQDYEEINTEEILKWLKQEYRY